jgi:hypothetical protein
MKSTPIFINAKDRKTCLQTLIERLIAQGYWNIHIINTWSTWPPMLHYLKSLRFPVYHCQPRPAVKDALWNCEILKLSGYRGSHFVYTDCDVVPDENCPDDWMKRLYDLLEKYPSFKKAGLGLRIDDLPECYALKGEVVAHESQFWNTVLEPDVFSAQIDTTLALYRPDTVGLCDAIRTGGKYVARHLPWYYDSGHQSEEHVYYLDHLAKNSTMWSRKEIAKK